MSTPVPPRPAAIDGATSPSRIRCTRAPASRSSPIRSSWRSRSRTTTSMSRTRTPLASATALTFSVGAALMSIASIPSGPTAIFSMYKAAPGKNIVPRSATAITAIALGWPSAQRRVPSSGSTATSTSGPLPLPTSSPLKSIGASSFSPSPITTMPAIEIVSSIARIASTAASSALSFSPRPTHRPHAIAAFSVTRTSSSARFLSGAFGGGTPSSSEACSATRLIPEMFSHSVGRLHPDQVEAPRNHRLRRPAEGEPECLRVTLEHAVLGVEAVEVVSHADGVVRDRVRPAPLGRLGNDARKLQQALDEVPLLLGYRRRRRRVHARVACIPEDAGDPRMHVLDVVDGILGRLLARKVDVDLDRLVR